MLLMGHRYYLPKLGRFLTQDPKGQSAGLNLYEYCDNNPLRNVDPDGLDIQLVKDVAHGETDAMFAHARHEFWIAVRYLMRDAETAHRIRTIIRSPRLYHIYLNNEGRDSYTALTGDIHWDPHSATRTLSNDVPPRMTGRQSAALGLAHEMARHAYLDDQNPARFNVLTNHPMATYDDANEWWVIEGIERRFALHFGEHPRHNHLVAPYREPSPIQRN